MDQFDLFKILRDEGKLTKVQLFIANETMDDPYEHTHTESYLNSITIQAFVHELSFSSLRWKYYAQLPTGSVQLICETHHENLIKMADKIKIGENYYKCYKDDSKGFAILRRSDYIIVVLERKNI